MCAGSLGCVGGENPFLSEGSQRKVVSGVNTPEINGSTGGEESPLQLVDAFEKNPG